MGNRLSTIVTRTGDDGNTGLADGSRRPKNDCRIHCLGEVDELNATIGLLISSIDVAKITEILHQIQHDLFDLGAELSQPGKQLLTEDYVDYIEQQVEKLNANLPALKEFILPAGSMLISQIHLTRTVCRRVERHFATLQQQEPVNPVSLKYINSVSDLFLIIARFIAQHTGQPEVYWKSQFSRLSDSS